MYFQAFQITTGHFSLQAGCLLHAEGHFLNGDVQSALSEASSLLLQLRLADLMKAHLHGSRHLSCVAAAEDGQEASGRPWQAEGWDHMERRA